MSNGHLRNKRLMLITPQISNASALWCANRRRMSLASVRFLSISRWNPSIYCTPGFEYPAFPFPRARVPLGGEGIPGFPTSLYISPNSTQGRLSHMVVGGFPLSQHEKGTNSTKTTPSSFIPPTKHPLSLLTERTLLGGRGGGGKPVGFFRVSPLGRGSGEASAVESLARSGSSRLPRQRLRGGGQQRGAAARGHRPPGDFHATRRAASVEVLQEPNPRDRAPPNPPRTTYMLIMTGTVGFCAHQIHVGGGLGNPKSSLEEAKLGLLGVVAFNPWSRFRCQNLQEDMAP